MCAQPLDQTSLIFCSGTLLGRPLADKIEAASAGGFDGLTLFPQDIQDELSAGRSSHEIRQSIADAGLQVEGLDPFLAWLPGEVPDELIGVRQGDFYVATEREFVEIAREVGGTSLNVVQAFAPTVDRDRAAEALAGLCDRVAEFGLSVTLEFVPWSGVADVTTALGIVERSGRPSARIMVDTWHWHRGARDLDALRAVPGPRFGGVQLNDAIDPPWDNLMQESTEARLVPGDGEIPLVDIVKALDAAGSRAPIGVEVFARDFADCSAAEVGRMCGEGARRVLSLARG